MLINLTNHPSTTWSENQFQQAVTQFGGVVDFQFPKILESMESDELIKTAKLTIDEIQNKFPEFKSILVMGEHTFTFAIVIELLKSGFSCYATVAPRDVLDEKNNIKISRFQFVKFRKYPDYRDLI